LLRRAGCRIAVAATTSPGHAAAIAADARRSAWDAVAVAGGDGTINEALNGLMRLAPAERPALGVIPIGTANVLAHELDVATVDRAAAAIVDGDGLAVHPGVANGRRFLMMAGVGFDARCVRRVDPKLKRMISKGAYLWAGVQELRAAKRPLYRIAAAGADFVVGSAIVARGRHYAGSYVCAARARLDRDAFEVCLLAGHRRADIVRYAVAIATGSIETAAGARFVTAAAVRVEGPPGEPVQADGDIVATLPVDLTIDPDAVSLLRPHAGAQAG
jgi:YegS/Rv2252/BmrU family lipid kinase